MTVNIPPPMLDAKTVVPGTEPVLMPYQWLPDPTAALRKASLEALLSGALLTAQLDTAPVRNSYDKRPDTQRFLAALEALREALA